MEKEWSLHDLSNKGYYSTFTIGICFGIEVGNMRFNGVDRKKKAVRNLLILQSFPD